MLDSGDLNVTKAAASYKLPNFVQDHLKGVRLLEHPNGWKSCMLVITPTLARLMLDCRDENHQRSIRKQAVAHYQRQLENDEWKMTHQGIAFDRKGRLMDGQNRLTAAILGDKEFPSLVWFGCGHDDVSHLIDGGATRNAKDALAFHGQQRSLRYMAIMRMMQYHGTGIGRKMTNQEVLEFDAIHNRSITFACEEISSHEVPTPVAAAVARAWYHCDLDKLKRFIAVLEQKSPATEPGDRLTVALNKLMNKLPQGGQFERNELMAKAFRAIQASMEGDTSSRLFPAELSVYPLPASGRPFRKSA